MSADPAALARLHAEGFTTPAPWSARAIADLLADPVCFLIGDATGFALGRAVLEEAELLTLVVPAAGRRRGLGRALLAGFETEAARRGAAQGFLEVAAVNGPAIALYRGAGWQEAGRRKNYYATPEGSRIDALVMRKTL